MNPFTTPIPSRRASIVASVSDPISSRSSLSMDMAACIAERSVKTCVCNKILLFRNTVPRKVELSAFHCRTIKRGDAGPATLLFQIVWMSVGGRLELVDFHGSIHISWNCFEVFHCKEHMVGTDKSLRIVGCRLEFIAVLSKHADVV